MRCSVVVQFIYGLPQLTFLKFSLFSVEDFSVQPCLPVAVFFSVFFCFVLFFVVKRVCVLSCCRCVVALLLLCFLSSYLALNSTECL